MLILQPNHRYMAHDITLIVNTSEITAGTRGASLGPAALMQVARTRKDTFFSTYPQRKVVDLNHLLDETSNYQFAKNIDGLVEIFKSCSTLVSETLQQNKFPFVLAGDHGSAGGTIAGIKKAFPDKRLGVVWIDAHGDLHSPYTTPSGNMHGMPLSTALAIDNKACQRNEPNEETIHLWEELKNLEDISPKISPEDLVFIGVRDTEKEEDYILENLSIKNYTVQDVRTNGTQEIIHQIVMMRR